jgi:hypothetical protein
LKKSKKIETSTVRLEYVFSFASPYQLEFDSFATKLILTANCLGSDVVRMSKILDLPEELFEVIFTLLITTPTRWAHALQRASFVACTAARLRLVCRQWADWLYQHQLYRTLTFDSASRSLAFIDSLRGRSTLMPRAKCQYLEVDFLWSSPHPPRSGQHDMITSDILESLVGLFSDTICTLDLKFVDFFTLPTRTIEAIGRMESLDNLHLDLSRWPSGDLGLPPPDPICFNSLLLEAQGLKSLHLALPVSLPPLEPGQMLGNSPYPAITHLDVEVTCLSPNVILGLSIALKPSLKLLSINDFGRSTDASLLLPVYESLRGTIEGLSVTSTTSLTPILDLTFPKLRVFAVHDSRDSLSDLLVRRLFSHAPIEVIAISSDSAKGSKPTFAPDPFTNLPQLQKLVFMNTPCDYSPAPMYLDTCQAHHVKCVYLDHNDISLIMVRQTLSV